MTLDEIIAEILNNNEASFSYDEIHEALAESENEQFDVFVRLSFHLSERVETAQEAVRAASFVQLLALRVLHFNALEARKSEEICDAIE